jgi:hypothetical protein
VQALAQVRVSEPALGWALELEQEPVGPILFVSEHR